MDDLLYFFVGLLLGSVLAAAHIWFVLVPLIRSIDNLEDQVAELTRTADCLEKCQETNREWLTEIDQTVQELREEVGHE